MKALVTAEIDNQRALRTIKLAHTLVWAVFAGCIVAIPLFALRREFTIAFVLISIVMAEVVVLVVNGMRCPLTGMASRYTDDRRDNFDIYLPLWVARYNKQIFGTLFVLSILYTALLWSAGH